MPNLLDILAALNEEQKEEVDNWEQPHHSFSDRAFGGKHLRTTIPLEKASMHVEPHPVVVDELKKHGAEVHNYLEGTATDKHGRIVKIGKMLNRSPHVKSMFDADPFRTGAAKHKDLAVTISRHPHDVAGMSTGQNWTSCMDMDKGGPNVEHLPEEVKEGTHVAYLHHKDDPELKRPIARIALKPFVEQVTKRKVLIPEGRGTYGDRNSDFDYTVNKWADTHFKIGRLGYRQSGMTYDDSGRNGYDIPSQSKALRLMKSEDPEERMEALMRPGFMEKMVNDPDRDIREHIAKYGSDKLRDKLIKDESGMVRRYIAQHGNNRHRDTLLNDENPLVRGDVAAYGTEAHRSHLLNDDSSAVKESIARHGSDKHRDILVKSEDPYVRRAIAESGNTKHHEALLNDEDGTVRQIIAEKSHHIPHLEHLANDKDSYTSQVAQRNLKYRLAREKDKR